MQKKHFPLCESCQPSSGFQILTLKPCNSQQNPSDLTFSAEETSPIFAQTSPNKFFLEISSIESSPTKNLTQTLQTLKSQILTLRKKFSTYKSDVKELKNENLKLKSKIIQLQEHLINVNVLSAGRQAKCGCNVF